MQATETNKPIQLNRLKKVQQTRSSLIAAVLHVSESEIIKGYKDYCSSWENDYPAYFHELLWELGLNTNQTYIRQDAISHRNRFNEVATCSRWYGNERSDDDWLSSGYASRDAIDKAKNNPLLDDTYRARHMTTDAQETLEVRDRYRKE